MPPVARPTNKRKRARVPEIHNARKQERRSEEAHLFYIYTRAHWQEGKPLPQRECIRAARYQDAMQTRYVRDRRRIVVDTQRKQNKQLDVFPSVLPTDSQKERIKKTSFNGLEGALCRRFKVQKKVRTAHPRVSLSPSLIMRQLNISSRPEEHGKRSAAQLLYSSHRENRVGGRLPCLLDPSKTPAGHRCDIQ